MCSKLCFPGGGREREGKKSSRLRWKYINPLNAELNPICHLLALFRVHHILHVSGLRVKVDL